MKVTERIGVEYQQWQKGEIVYISAPTGSGKTEFVLETLLNYAIENNRTILYLVNRHILKEQLLERINSKQNQRVHDGKYVDVKRYIRVETYQTLENKNEIEKNYFYIVADECQYGYCDSLFNPNTFLSYSLIMSAVDSCRIFISATMDNMRKYIDNSIQDCRKMYQSKIFRITQWKTWSYEIKADYSHINLICVNDMSELECIIESEKESKWLIFTDQKDNGKRLRKNLQEKKCDVIYFDADSEEGSDEAEIINEIVKKQKTKKKILIVTSVMDNGISIIDKELGNMVVMADTPEEFLQMLGRKRMENSKEKLNLYVMKKSLSEFETRKLRYIDRLLKAVNRFDINCDYSCDEILRECFRNPYYYEEVSKICLVYKNKDTNKYAVTVSPFSYNQLLYLSGIYSEVIDSFKEGDDFSFLRVQAQWIGMTNVDEVIKDCIGRKVDINSSLIEKELERLYQLSQDNAELIDEMKNVFHANRKISKEEIAEYKKKVEEKCKELLNTSFVDGQIEYASALKDLLSTMGVNFEDAEWQDIKDSLEKHRLVDENLFTKAMTYVGLSYRLKKTNLGAKNKGGFTIYEIYKAEE